MNYKKCEYCKENLSDPDDIVVGTHLFSTPKMYHYACYNEFKANGSYFKKPRSMWMTEKLHKALETSKYRAVTYFILALFTPLLISRILSGMGDFDRVGQIALSIMLMIALIFFIRGTFTCWKKYKGYVTIYEYYRNMVNNK